MKKKVYNGLSVRLVPIEGTSIITASACSLVAVQYYVDSPTQTVCETGEIGTGTGYSYNWTEEPYS